MRVYQFRHFGSERMQGLTNTVPSTPGSLVQFWCKCCSGRPHQCHPHAQEAQPMATIIRRPGKDGQTSYHVQVRRTGAPPRSATFTKLSDARKWVQVTEAAIFEGRHLPTSGFSALPMKDRRVCWIAPPRAPAQSDGRPGKTSHAPCRPGSAGAWGTFFPVELSRTRRSVSPTNQGPTRPREGPRGLQKNALSSCRPTGRVDPTPAALASGSLDLAALE